MDRGRRGARDRRRRRRRLGRDRRLDRHAHADAGRSLRRAARPQPRRSRFRRGGARTRCRRGDGRPQRRRHARGSAVAAGRRHARRSHRARPLCARAQRRAHRRGDRQRRQDRDQGGAAHRARRLRCDLCFARQPQQPLGRAAVAGTDAAGCGLWRVRARHEPSGRDRRADPAGAARTSLSSPRWRPPISAFSGRSKKLPTPRPKSFSASNRAGSPSSTATTRITRGLPRRRPKPGWRKSSALAPIPRPRCGLCDCVLEPHGSTIEASVGGKVVRFRLNVPGRHWVMNALAVLGAAVAAGCDPRQAAEALAAFEAPPGRGRRHRLRWRGGTLTLIDESYNASPAAMLAALAVLATTSPEAGGRRVAVLGDMLELGDTARRLHRELAEPLIAAEVDRVFLIGTEMAALDEVLPAVAPRRIVAVRRSGYPRAVALSRTRRRGDGQGLLRRARRPHRRARCSPNPHSSRPDDALSRCSTRSRTSFRPSTCFATSRSGRAARSSPRC